ncbi:MAG: hypothetical protein D6677_10575 [Calditrichaeota bacterium]|nr:MAG: hypothetical protein D6677_10575 [Calditrichota bacterium]
MRTFMFVLSLIFFVSVPSYAQQGPGHKRPGMMQGKGPMHGKMHKMTGKKMGMKQSLVPHYMRVVKMQGDLLNLTDDQNAQLEKWRTEHQPKMEKLMMEIKNKKKAVFDASIQGAPAEQILSLVDEKNTLEKQMVQAKTRCRDFIRSVLNEEQWQKLLATYKTM